MIKPKINSFFDERIKQIFEEYEIISYLETCCRNGISRFEASKRLVYSNPYTIVKEISDLITSRVAATTA